MSKDTAGYAKMVSEPPFYLHEHPCRRKGIIERDGKLWCRQHDPEAVKVKREKQQTKLDAEFDASREKYRRLGAEAFACDGIKLMAIEQARQCLLHAIRKTEGGEG